MMGAPNLPEIKTHDDEEEIVVDQKWNGRAIKTESEHDESRPYSYIRKCSLLPSYIAFSELLLHEMLRCGITALRKH